MLTTPRTKEEIDEDCAIALAIANAGTWFNRVSNIDGELNIWAQIEKDTPKSKKEQRYEVSPNYVCRRCKRPGHHISKCVTNGDPAFDIVVPRGVAGIPRSFTKDITAEGMNPHSITLLTLL